MQVVGKSSPLGPDTKITFEGVCRAIAFTVHLDDQMLTQTEVSVESTLDIVWLGIRRSAIPHPQLSWKNKSGLFVTLSLCSVSI